MRILMVSKAFVVGSYQTKLEALSRLADIDLSVMVPACWKGPEGVTHLERTHVAGYQLIVAPMRFNGHFHLHYYPSLGQEIRRLQPDIVHMDEEPYNLATYLGLRAAKAAGARTIFFTWQNLLRTYPWPFRKLEQACYGLADCALAGNEDAAQVLRQKGYAGPVCVIPQFGVEPAPFAAQTDAPADPAVLRVGYAGRLVPEKGISLLLDALAGLATPWQCLIAGNGPLQLQLQARAQSLGLGERVRFLGRVPSGEMPAFFRQIDVLVLPSVSRPNWAEQFGRVLVEAMAAEVTVVGSRSGEIPRVVGDAGLLFPEGDASALRGCLRQLAEDPALRRRLAQAGRARALEHFTQAAIARRTHDVYSALVAGSFGAAGSMV